MPGTSYVLCLHGHQVKIIALHILHIIYQVYQYNSIQQYTFSRYQKALVSGSKYSTQPPASWTSRLRCASTLREYAVGTTCTYTHVCAAGIYIYNIYAILYEGGMKFHWGRFVLHTYILLYSYKHVPGSMHFAEPQRGPEYDTSIEQPGMYDMHL